MTTLTNTDRSKRSAQILALYHEGGSIRGMSKMLRLPHRVVRNALRAEGIAAWRKGR